MVSNRFDFKEEEEEEEEEEEVEALVIE